MPTPLRLLLVEDCAVDAELLVLALRRAGYEPLWRRVDTAEQLRHALETEPWHLVVSDYQLPGFSAPAALELLGQCGADIPFIIVSGAVGEETAVSSLRAGARDFILKSNLARLGPAVTRELKDVEVRRARERAEMALRDSEEHYRLAACQATELYAEAERARAVAERANRAKAEFLAVMSHELRTPLTAILGYTELLLDETAGPLSQTQREELRHVGENGEHLLRLIERVLDFAAIDGSRGAYVRTDVAVAAVVAASAELIAPLAEAKGIAFRTEPASSVLTVSADAARVQQILRHLLENAVKYTSAGGTIVVSSHAEGAAARIRVADTGSGVSPAMTESIFEPFAQADASATRRYAGVGLGLSISRSLAREMDGDVVLEKSDPGGSTFALILPQPVHRAALVPEGRRARARRATRNGQLGQPGAPHV